MKILIIGEKRHGKDATAEILEKSHGLTHMASSQAGANKFIFSALKDKYGYDTIVECFEDRHDHRGEWYDLICAYNADDPARLAKEIVSEHDIYVGMRNYDELKVCKEIKLFDVILGIIRPGYQKESTKSMSIDVKKESDILIYNNQGLDELVSKVNLAYDIAKLDRISQVIIS